MNALDKKLFRDILHIWGQALAIALVLAAGVSTLILAVGAYRSLFETREAYYERYRFAHIFASTKRAPNYLKDQLSQIEGVATVETRIVSRAILDIEGMKKPAAGLILSLPTTGPPVLNSIYLKTGRYPAPLRDDEVIVSEAFAKAHGFTIGSTLKAILDGRKRTFTIVGTGLSPEFIYSLGPGDIVPDDRRFGLIWLPVKAAEAAYDLDGAFNSVSLRLRRDANRAVILEKVDAILKPYGGIGAYLRKDQVSHAFIDAELTQLKAMSQIIPPIFIIVAAFLINMTLARLIAMEREQIGLLKALGYSRLAIATHYLKFVLIIATFGTAIGLGAGLWLGRGLTRLYGDFFHFPFLVFLNTPDILIMAAGIGIGAAVIGALRSVWLVVGLSPAVAMSPPTPVRYKRFLPEWIGKAGKLPQSVIMIFRHLIRWPIRALFTVIGISLSCALLVSSLFIDDSLDFMIDVTFYQTMRQDVMVDFAKPLPKKAVLNLERIKGVMRVEPRRNVSAILENGHKKRRIAVTGIQPDADLQRMLTPDLIPIRLPKTGIVISEKLAGLLNISIGEYLTIKVQEGRQPIIRIPVVAITQGFIGLNAFMDLKTLNAHMGDGNVISGANLSLDTDQQDSFYAELKSLPVVSFIALLKSSLESFNKTISQNMLTMMMVYLVLSVIITFGVVYNSARIHLSERARELASLRVLGFTRSEVSFILLGELAFLTIIAIPLGCLLGYGLATLIIQGTDNDFYRVPMIIEMHTYVYAALITIGSAVISALIVRKRIDNLNLIEVLKTRE